MEAILHTILIYFVLFFLFRISGKRTMEETTPFGMVLILLISTSVADAIKNEDKSITNAILLACTLIGLHVGISAIKSRNTKIAHFIGDKPTLLVNKGELLHERLRMTRLRKDDILAAARENNVASIDKIKYAVLELDGSISIIKEE